MQSHQELGNKLELFFIDETSPGSIFWKPRGALLFNNLSKLMRDHYDNYNYVEVISPNIYDKKLWVTSGHWDKYQENMFLLEDFHHIQNNDNKNNEIENNHNHIHDDHHNETETQDTNNETETQGTQDEKNEQKVEQKIEQKVEQKIEQKFSLKPMNCPGHCLIFRNMKPLAKDLPIRMAEFGVLHRNEASGALHGLTRVRRFQQDDAHIFCKLDQIRQEVLDTLSMIKQVYNLFDLHPEIKLSTRPENYIGEIELWDKAENILESVIQEFTDKKEIEKNIGDGAFYGPKIDVTLTDKYKRQVQCGTIQLDFNLPSKERFDLTYTDENDHSRHHPVIIHRAVLGSIERFIGIILEHTQGRFPIRVSPYPIMIVTLNKDFNDSANNLRQYMQQVFRETNLKMCIDIDDSSNHIREKVKSAENRGYCYILTIGKRETIDIEKNIESAKVAVRVNNVIKNLIVSELIKQIKQEMS